MDNDEIERLSEEIAWSIRRISQLEAILTGKQLLVAEKDENFDIGILERISKLETQIIELQNSQNYLNTAGSLTEKRALKLLQYVEKHGRLNSKQAKQILNCIHRAQVHRAMELVALRCEEVELKKSKSGMLQLVSRYCLGNLRRVQVELP